MQDLNDWVLQGNLIVSILQTKKTTHNFTKKPHQLSAECDWHLTKVIMHPFFPYKEL